MAAQGDDNSGDFDTPVWRLVLFFVLILVIDTVWELVDEHVIHTIRKKQHKGLSHAYEQLKFEIMALGLVSLLLVVFEEYLLKICVDAAVKEEYEKDEQAAYSRRLLAAEADCPDGKEPLWSSALIHKIHILIFLIAVSHVIYAVVSLTMSMLSMRKWQEFETTAREGELLPLPTDQLQKVGESKIIFGLRQAVRQFVYPIDRPTYIALRRLFFERMPVDASFNFADFVTDFLTEEFARIVKLEFLMWVIAIVWIAIPSGWYAGFWMTGIFFIASVAAGAKLHVIVMSLARQAYSLYYEQDHLHSGDGGGDSSTSSKVSVRIGSGPGGDTVPEAVAPDTATKLGLFRKSAVALPQRGGASDGRVGPVGEAVEGHDEEERLGSADTSTQHAPAAQARPPAQSSAAAGLPGAQPGAAPEVPLTTVLEFPEQESNAFRGTVSSDSRRSQQLRRSRSASDVQRISEELPSLPTHAGARLPDVTSSDNSPPHSGKSGLGGSCAYAASTGHGSPRAASPKRSRQPREGSDAVSPNGCLACVTCGTAWNRKGKSRIGPARVKPWAETDFKNLFWLQRPRLMLRIFQYAYFENALSLAVLAFAFWQHESSMFAGVVGDKSTFDRSVVIAAFVFIALDVALLVHSSCFVLPVYALTAAAANFNTPEGLLEFAKKRGIRPDIVEFLEETVAATPPLTPHADAMHTCPEAPQSPHEIEPFLSLPPAPDAHSAAGNASGPARQPSPAPEIVPESALPRASSGAGTSSAAPTAGVGRGASHRTPLSRMSAAPTVYRSSPPPHDPLPGPPTMASATPAAAAQRVRPPLSRASCPVASPGTQLSTLSRRSAVGGAGPVAQPRPGLSRASLSRPSVVQKGSGAQADVIAPAMSVAENPQHRDMAYVQPSVEGLIQSMFQARLKELRNTAASSGALTPSVPSSPSYGYRDTMLQRLTRTSASIAADGSGASSSSASAQPLARRSAAAGAVAMPQPNLNRHSDMSAVMARQSARVREEGGPDAETGGSSGEGAQVQGPVKFFPKSTSAGALGTMLKGFRGTSGTQ